MYVVRVSMRVTASVSLRGSLRVRVRMSATKETAQLLHRPPPSPRRIVALPFRHHTPQAPIPSHSSHRPIARRESVMTSESLDNPSTR